MQKISSIKLKKNSGFIEKISLKNKNNKNEINSDLQ